MPHLPSSAFPQLLTRQASKVELGQGGSSSRHGGMQGLVGVCVHLQPECVSTAGHWEAGT